MTNKALTSKQIESSLSTDEVRKQLGVSRSTFKVNPHTKALADNPLINGRQHRFKKGDVLKAQRALSKAAKGKTSAAAHA